MLLTVYGNSSSHTMGTALPTVWEQLFPQYRNSSSHNLCEHIFPQSIGRWTNLPTIYGYNSSHNLWDQQSMRCSHNLWEDGLTFPKICEQLFPQSMGTAVPTIYGNMVNSSHNLWEEVLLFLHSMGRWSTLPTI